MKNTLTLVFALAALAVSAVCLYQARQLRTRHAEVAQFQEALAVQTRQLEAAKAAEERLKRHRSSLSEQLDVTSVELEAERERATRAASNAIATAKASAPATNKPRKGMEGFGGTLAKMLENPEMKKMIAQQQRAVMDTMYGPLFKELGLTKEQTERFKELLLAQQMKGVEQAGALFGGNAEGKDKAEMAKSLTETTKQSEEEIKAFLGEDGYTKYKDYRETLGERMQLNQFNQQLAGGDHPLSSDQQTQLLSIMNEERKALTTDFANLGWAGGQPSNPQDILAEDKLNQVLDLQQGLGQRVYERARFVLQPEQLNAFGAFQTNQLSMQRFGIKMLQSMQGGENASTGDAAAPVPTP
jgi:hypothetical protein